MGKRLTDKERKKIISDYTTNGNLRETSRMNNVTAPTVTRILNEIKDNSLLREITQKQEDNTKSTLEYMETQHNTKKQLIENLLKAMNEKSTKVDMFTGIRDLATAYGIIIDKELKVVELNIKKQELDIKNKENQDIMSKLDELLAEQKNA